MANPADTDTRIPGAFTIREPSIPDYSIITAAIDQARSEFGSDRSIGYALRIQEFLVEAGVDNRDFFFLSLIAARHDVDLPGGGTNPYALLPLYNAAVHYCLSRGIGGEQADFPLPEVREALRMVGVEGMSDTVLQTVIADVSRRLLEGLTRMPDLG